MSTLYGARPSSASASASASARGHGSGSGASGGGPPPRFEFGTTRLQRPEASVSMALRTQTHAYPHHTEGGAAAQVHSQPTSARAGGGKRRPVRPSSAAPGATATRPPVIRPATSESQMRDRYLPTPPPPYAPPASATMLPLPHTYAHVPGTPFPYTFEDYLPSSTQGGGGGGGAAVAPQAPVVPAMPSAYSIARAHARQSPVRGGGPEAHSYRPRVNSNYLTVEPRARAMQAGATRGPPPRHFMATPAYFAFLDAQEEAERRSAEEAAHAAAALLKGQRAGDRDEYTPTIPYPARFSTAHSASAASAAAGAAATPVSAVVRLPTALGLHTRTLDALQVLSSLRAQLDQCFEIVRIDERERRGREARQAQAELKRRQMELLQAQAQTNVASAAAPTANGGIQRIQAGHISIPNTPNVTSTTLALLAHTPAHSSERHRTPSAGASAAAVVADAQPTFLTDAEIESHALSNLTPAQRRSAFGRGLSAAAASPSGEQKEAPFDATDLSTHPDAPPRNKNKAAPPKLGEPRPEATRELPDDIVYTEEMCREFEESVKQWGQFLMQSHQEAAAASAAAAAAATAAAQAHHAHGGSSSHGGARSKASSSNSSIPSPAVAHSMLQADLLLVLRDACSKYASLIRLAMNPNPQPAPKPGPSPGSDPHTAASRAQTHHLLPRMMETTWKLVMLVVEVALGRRMEAAEGDAMAMAMAANHAAHKHNDSSVSSAPSPVPSPRQQQQHAAATPLDTPRGAMTIGPTDVATLATPSDTAAPSSSGAGGTAPLSVDGAASSFDPLRADHRAELDARMSTYATSMVLTGPGTATSASLAAAADVRNALAVQQREESLRDTGMYSVGLMLQRDSLLASSERLMRENELLKLRLRESHAQVAQLQSQQDTDLRSLAQRGEDTVGMALDELDEWMEDAMDARREQMDAVARVSDLAYDYSQKHAASVAAEATADESHRESMDTLRRLQVREAEMAALRQAELEQREAAAQSAATEAAKSAAVLDRELRLLELLTSEEIEAKVATVSDAPTLRAMVCKLLHIKVKRPTHETPAQRVARVRKESTPRLLRSLLLRVPSQRLLPLKQLARQLLEIYLCKICTDDIQTRDKQAHSKMAGSGAAALPPGSNEASSAMSSRRGGGGGGGGGGAGGSAAPTLPAFLYEWMQQRYGLRRIAENNLVELLRSVQVYLYPDRPSHRPYAHSLSLQSSDMLDRCARPRLAWFARLCHLYIDEPLPPEAGDFFMFLLRALQEAAEQAVPPAFSTAYSSKDSAPDTARAMLRTLELACVPISAAGVGAGTGAGTGTANSARATKRNSLDHNASLGTGLVPRVGGVLTSGVHAVAAVALRDEELTASGGSLSLYVPLFLAVECAAHAFRELGYSDAAMDDALVDLEREYIYPLNTSARAGTESNRVRTLLKQVVARQMLRSAGVGAGAASASPAAVFERFDTDRSGVVTAAKLRVLISMDDDTAARLDSMLLEHCGASGGLICADLAQALSPDYRLCVPLDTLLERATLAWLDEHQALTLRYRTAAAAVEGPGAKGMLNHTELLALIQVLEPAAEAVGSAAGALPRAIRSFANKLFREGMEMERRDMEAARAAEAAAAARAAKKNKRRGGSGKKKKDASSSPPTPAPPPPPPAVVVAVSLDSLGAPPVDPPEAAAPVSALASPTHADAAADPAAGPQSDDAASLPPPSPERRSVQFALQTEVQGSGSGSTRPSPSSKAASSRPAPLGPTDLIRVETCVVLLRRHRIGLQPRKPFNEFRCFLRRYRRDSGLAPARHPLHAARHEDGDDNGDDAAEATPITSPTAAASVFTPATSAASSVSVDLELDQAAMPITTIAE